MKIHAYAAHRPKDQLKPFTYEPAPLGPDDIDVKISHCGICHSDIHILDNDWQTWSEGTAAVVPGHEIIGSVTQKGGQVTHLQIGDRVGIGWQRSSCLECEPCLGGNENFCPDSEATCLGHYGGFADSIRIDSRFAFPIPQNLSSENAAPLLCGGATVYTPLKRFNVRPEHRVGVIGIGGLGHLAIQFARAFGCEVTAFSTTPDKEEEARAFGATNFIVTSDASAMAGLNNRLDFILSTVYAPLDWEAYLRLLRLDGTLCLVGVPRQPMAITPHLLMSGRRRVTASVIGSRSDIREMLEFAARHKIQARTEAVPLAEVNAALDRVRRNTARYRMVLTVK